MEMTFDEHMAQLKKLKSFHNGSYGASINFALDIIRKYQKIEQIYQKWNEVNDFSYNQAIIKDLEQEPRWIPVSERLPENNGDYLVTIKSSDGTAIITFQMVDHFGPGWLHEEKTRKIIAWMPLPKSYREVEE